MTDTMPPRFQFREHTQSTTIRGVRMSHLSIEVGHFYIDELDDDVKVVEDRFRRLAPWIEAARASVTSGANPPRVSTCFLIDDYFVTDRNPTTVIDKILTAADKAGVAIDYLARESACATIGERAVAEFVLSKVQAEPEPGTNGSRPPAQQTGWLTNGRRSWGSPQQAMQELAWAPPEEYGKRNHSVFVDIELFEASPVGAGRGRWSCSFLAAVWQLLRLGVLRYDGEPLVVPEQRSRDAVWGANWAKLPAVIQLNPDAEAFAAYRTLSILPQNYLPIEHSVRTILDHVVIEEPVLNQLRERARGEKIELPESITDRVTHVFVEGPPRAAR